MIHKNQPVEIQVDFFVGKKGKERNEINAHILPKCQKSVMNKNKYCTYLSDLHKYIE